MGEFKLIKSDVNINKKNFIGYSDGDYDLVNQFHKNSIDFSSKNNSFFGSSVFIGYDLTNKDVSKKIFDICSSGQKFVNINLETNMHNNLYMNKNMYVKDNAFFNKEIFLSNSIDLEEETINVKKSMFNYNFNKKLLSINSYKKLLSNIIEQTKKTITNKHSSLNFITNKNNNFYSQSIVSVNKKFILNKEIGLYITCFMLIYVVKINNKTISCKPVLDTFIIIDSNDEEVEVCQEEIDE